ncbi:EamA family transporter RarD [Candidatus Chloroploca sp. M-50]|uniref:EamA family transporter RarD n=1 Tax=Candidatus Chloroploca mongolica TaxID=2528176 RepID=A0ABS4D6H9_9CHLR|nr:EamA family transporter RarD [Candidatus Chloroploca mongolica]
MNKGVLYAIGAYVSWGLLPIFWKALHHVPALEILANRVVWAMVAALIVGLFAFRTNWGWLFQALRQPRTVLVFVLSASLLAFNWGLYIWAVNADHVVETSLGYFINPLVNVFLGVVVLRERLRIGQGLGIALALAGVLYLTLTYGSPPWIALSLAGSFGLYGLLRKTAPLASIQGFTLETLVMALPALVFLGFVERTTGGTLGHADLVTTTLLISSGVVTAVPLLLFAAGARLVTLTTLGLLQYIAPTLQFLLGVFVYGEYLSTQRLFGFVLVWIALAIYSIEGIITSRRRQTMPPAQPSSV